MKKLWMVAFLSFAANAAMASEVVLTGAPAKHVYELLLALAKAKNPAVQGEEGVSGGDVMGKMEISADGKKLVCEYDLNNSVEKAFCNTTP